MFNVLSQYIVVLGHKSENIRKGKMLTEQQRREYLLDCDSPQCNNCNWSCPIEAAYNPEWQIGVEIDKDENVTLFILCPECAITEHVGNTVDKSVKG